MARGKKHTPEQIVNVLRQIEVAIANGKTTPAACKEAGFTEQAYYRKIPNSSLSRIANPFFLCIALISKKTTHSLLANSGSFISNSLDSKKILACALALWLTTTPWGMDLCSRLRDGTDKKPIRGGFK